VIIPAGPEPSNPPGVLGSRRMTAVLAVMRGQFDIVLVDTAPLLAVSDAVPLMTAADATIVVSRVDSTARDAARRVRRLLSRAADVDTLGIVANDVRSAR
jgi:Mrp family chromosome partitioning ATPase